MDILNDNSKLPALLVFIAAISSLSACFTTNFLKKEKATAESQSSILEDRDGNVYTLKVMPDKKQWMTANLNIDIPGSYCYEDMKQNCSQYGRLYIWESAQKGCNILGEGWRLPTDDEWRQMAEQYGGVANSSGSETGKAAYQALLQGGGAEFNAFLGGGRDLDGKYDDMGGHGFYWTATESDTGMAVFYNFAKGAGRLFAQEDGEKSRAFSVRCVRDVGKNEKRR